MAISDLAATGTPKIPWQTCQVCHGISTLPPKKAAIVEAALRDENWRFTEIRDNLADDPEHPLHLEAQALRRHARGQCAARTKLR